MPSLETFLAVAALIALGAWAALSIHLLMIQRRRIAARRLVSEAIALTSRTL